MTKRFFTRAWIAVTIAAAAAFAPAQADTWPDRPIKLVVPYPAGGASDRHMRLVAQLLSRELGQPVVVDNKPGGSGTLGTSAVGQTAQPDGYTIAQYPMGMLRVPHLQKVSWHPIDDFTFIAGVSGYTFGVVVRSDSPYRTIQEFLEDGKKRPGEITYGSAGVGTGPHLLMKELADAAGAQLTHVPFKGSADVQTNLLGGHVMAASDASTFDKFVDEGRMRLLVTFGERPTKKWPDVPTAHSLGYGVVGNSPYGIVGPKGMPLDIVEKLTQALKHVVESPENLALMEQLNQEVWFVPTDKYRAWAVETFEKEGMLLERMGLAAH